jgi:hypothetical protein
MVSPPPLRLRFHFIKGIASEVKGEVSHVCSLAEIRQFIKPIRIKSVKNYFSPCTDILQPSIFPESNDIGNPPRKY